MFPLSISFLLVLFCVCLLMVWVLTKGIPLHSAAMSIAISYTPEKCQHHLIALTTVFLLLELLGELLIACLWGDLSHHHCFN